MSADCYLECSHCGCQFLASKRQQKRVRSAGIHRVYCSQVCRDTGAGLRLRKPLPYQGTCPGCGRQFGSRTAKKFCSMKCYTGSAEFKQMLVTNRWKATAARVLQVTGEPPKPKVEITCMNCGAKWIERPSRKSRFCSRRCYRQYMAGRFDRWIANPQSIALPQSFDEFLSQEELPCLVEGCDWRGLHLGNHVNFAHGIPVREFKRAVGFNLKTGLVTPAVSDILSERPHIQAGGPVWFQKGHSLPAAVKSYRSLEGREHGAKTRAMLMGTVEMPEQLCRECGRQYRPELLGYSSKFCSVTCRNIWYRRRERAREVPLNCAECGQSFLSNRAQQRREAKALPVFCTVFCRQKRNARHARLALAALRGGARGEAAMRLTKEERLEECLPPEVA